MSGTRIIIGRCNILPGDICHGHKLKEDEVRIEIIAVREEGLGERNEQNASYLDEFCTGAIMRWKKRDIKESEGIAIEDTTVINSIIESDNTILNTVPRFDEEVYLTLASGANIFKAKFKDLQL